MKGRARIHRNVPANEVVNRVPGEFRQRLAIERLDLPAYTVVCVPGQRRSSTTIIDSPTSAKVIEAANGGVQPLVFVAHAFTTEALAMLQARHAITIVVHSSEIFTWTDDSWAQVRDRT